MLLASGSADQTIRVWNFEDGSQFTLRGHTDYVNSVKIDLDSRTLFSASDDLTIRLWDLESRTTLRVFNRGQTSQGHVGYIQQVVVICAQPFGDTQYTKIFQVLPKNFELDNESYNDPHESSDDALSTYSTGNEANGYIQGDFPSASTSFEYPVESSMTTPPTSPARPNPPRYFLTSALDSQIRLWETHTGRCLRTFFGHLEGVSKLLLYPLLPNVLISLGMGSCREQPARSFRRSRPYDQGVGRPDREMRTDVHRSRRAYKLHWAE